MRFFRNIQNFHMHKIYFMIELFLILFRFSVKNNQIYEILNATELQGKYTDINYIKKYKIQQKYFVYNSSGDIDNYPISNAFDDVSNTIWVSKHSNTNLYHPYIIINFSNILISKL